MKINFNEFLFVGVFLISLAFYFFGSILFTSKSTLIEKKGKIENIKLDYNLVKSRRGGQSTKCELTIFLKEDNTKYTIFKNIGQSTFYSKFEKIRRELKINQYLKIWIRKDEELSIEPIVFQVINQRNKILYDIKDAKSLSQLGFIGAFSLGLIFVFLSLKKKS